MTYMDPNDPTRVPTDEPVRRPTGVPDRGGISVWGFPLIVAAALVILGFVFFGTPERSTIASSERARDERADGADACSSGAQPTQAVTSMQRGLRCAAFGSHAAEAHAAGAVARVGAAIARAKAAPVVPAALRA